MEVQPGKLWNQFVHLYNKYFTNPLEWEDPELWKTKITYDIKENLPVVHVTVAVTQDHNGKDMVIAGMMYEHYRSSHVGFMTYLLVEPQWRKQGLSKALLSRAINELSKIEASSGNYLSFIGDSENPDMINDSQSTMPTRDRYLVMQRLGGIPIDIKYVQPCLIGGSGFCHHLILWSFDVEPFGNKISKETLVDFLSEEYKSLGIANPEFDKDFIEMTSTINKTVTLLETA